MNMCAYTSTTREDASLQTYANACKFTQEAQICAHVLHQSGCQDQLRSNLCEIWHAAHLSSFRNSRRPRCGCPTPIGLRLSQDGMAPGRLNLSVALPELLVEDDVERTAGSSSSDCCRSYSSAAVLSCFWLWWSGCSAWNGQDSMTRRTAHQGWMRACDQVGETRSKGPSVRWKWLQLHLAQGGMHISFKLKELISRTCRSIRLRASTSVS